MSPQMLILHQSSPDIYHFLAEYYNFKKNIGPAADSMSYSIMVLYKAISPLFDLFSAVFFHIGILASLACLNQAGQELWQVFDYSYKY